MHVSTWEKERKAHAHGQSALRTAAHAPARRPRRPPACPRLPPGPERRVLAAWMPKRGRRGALVLAHSRRCRRLFTSQVHNGQCPICIEDFEEGARVWRTPCAHAACENCLEPYLRPFIDTSAADSGKIQSAYAYANCALCRAAFDPEEKKAAELAQEADRSRRELERAATPTQENAASATAPAAAPPPRSSTAAFPALGITAPAEGSQAGSSSTPPTPESEAAASLFCPGLSDDFCRADGKAAWSKVVVLAAAERATDGPRRPPACARRPCGLRRRATAA